MWEFATGTGLEKRSFNYGEHPFATQYINGRLSEILSLFNDRLVGAGYKIRPTNTIFYNIALPFSPSINPASWGQSIARHLTSNKVEFFVGGAIGKVRINNNNIEGQITNATSRNSLFLHVAKNYDRSDGNRPLSTIYQ